MLRLIISLLFIFIIKSIYPKSKVDTLVINLSQIIDNTNKLIYSSNTSIDFSVKKLNTSFSHFFNYKDSIIVNDTKLSCDFRLYNRSFVLDVINYSKYFGFIRNNIGGGYYLLQYRLLNSTNISFSTALLYEYVEFYNKTIYNLLRDSYKIKLEIKLGRFYSKNFIIYQPIINDRNNFNIQTSLSLSYKVSNKVRLFINNNYVIEKYGKEFINKSLNNTQLGLSLNY